MKEKCSIKLMGSVLLSVSAELLCQRWGCLGKNMSKAIPSVATKFFLQESTCLSINTVCSPPCSAEPATYVNIDICTDHITESRADIYKFLVVYQCFLFPFPLKAPVLYQFCCSVYTTLTSIL